MKISVLGAGLIGSAIIKDLAAESTLSVSATDSDFRVLESLANEVAISYDTADLRDKNVIADRVADADLVVCALPGYMGFETLKQVILCGKDVVDISFFDEDPFLLDELARAQEVTAVVDCGVSPGLHNIILGYVDAQLDRVQRTACYVGGLPEVRQWPYEYKAVFSPSDIIELYTRPSRFVEHGQMVVRPALSDIELLDFPQIGTLEAFNTDGLRTLMRTMDAPFMIEKTLRYPGHANIMRVFRDSGFFDTDPIDINGQSITPRAFTSTLLFDQWELHEGEEDLTVMKVIVEGERAGKSLRYTFDLIDHYDAVTRTTSMARTTGYTCTEVVRQVLAGSFTRKGISPPEFIGRTEGCFERLLQGYETRGIHLRQDITELNAS